MYNKKVPSNKKPLQKEEMVILEADFASQILAPLITSAQFPEEKPVFTDLLGKKRWVSDHFYRSLIKGEDYEDALFRYLRKEDKEVYSFVAQIACDCLGSSYKEKEALVLRQSLSEEEELFLKNSQDRFIRALKEFAGEKETHLHASFARSYNRTFLLKGNRKENLEKIITCLQEENFTDFKKLLYCLQKINFEN